MTKPVSLHTCREAIDDLRADILLLPSVRLLVTSPTSALTVSRSSQVKSMSILDSSEIACLSNMDFFKISFAVIRSTVQFRSIAIIS